MECQWNQNAWGEDYVPCASYYQSLIQVYLDSHENVEQVFLGTWPAPAAIRLSAFDFSLYRFSYSDLQN